MSWKRAAIAVWAAFSFFSRSVHSWVFAVKNTWSWDDYWTLGVPVTLKQGASTVSFENASAWAPDIDRIELAPVRRLTGG